MLFPQPQEAWHSMQSRRTNQWQRCFVLQPFEEVKIVTEHGNNMRLGREKRDQNKAIFGFSSANSIFLRCSFVSVFFSSFYSPLWASYQFYGRLFRSGQGLWCLSLSLLLSSNPRSCRPLITQHHINLFLHQRRGIILSGERSSRQVKQWICIKKALLCN